MSWHKSEIKFFSGYGKLGEAVERHSVTLIGDERKLVKESKTAFYKHSTALSMENGESSCIEIECTKKRINDDRPIALAVAILQYSKLLFLRFVYNVLFRFLQKDSFRLNYADTDSLCISKFYIIIKCLVKIFHNCLMFVKLE